jgi:hypothetical protein
MNNWVRGIYLPALATIGVALLVAGIGDPRYQSLAIAGSVLLGSVLIALSK